MHLVEDCVLCCSKCPEQEIAEGQRVFNKKRLSSKLRPLQSHIILNTFSQECAPYILRCEKNTIVPQALIICSSIDISDRIFTMSAMSVPSKERKAVAHWVSWGGRRGWARGDGGFEIKHVNIIKINVHILISSTRGGSRISTAT